MGVLEGFKIARISDFRFKKMVGDAGLEPATASV